MEEFFAYLKDYGEIDELIYPEDGGMSLLKSKAETIKHLNAKRAELSVLLAGLDYKNFETKNNELNENLKRMRLYLEQEAKEALEQKKEPPVAVVKPPIPAEAIKPPVAVPATPAPAPVAAMPAERPTPPLSTPKEPRKKGLWERFKGGVSQVFNRETGKVAGKVTYSSIASATGYKLVTDAVYGAGTWAYGLITGKKDAAKGDIAEWLRGRKETQSAKDYITMAYQDLLVSLEKIREKKDLAEHEKIENRIVNFREKIESAKIAPEAKKALLDKLLEISEKHKQEIGAVAQERNKEVQKILDAYLHAKVSGMQIARDAMNFALTASGFLMLRGLMYAGVSAVERARRAKREYAKQTAEQGAKKSELGFVAKDIMVNAAIETAHGLTGGVFSKEKLGAKRRTINFIKSVGTVARGFGIYGVAISSAEAPQHTLDNLISGIKEHGVLSTIYDNSVHNAELIVKNAEHAGHLVAHPTEILEQKTSITPTTEQHEVSLPLHEHQPLAEHTPVAVSQEAPIAEHHETPIQAEMVEHGNHTVAVVELSNKDGILNGVNKIIHNNPNVFVHENGQAWSENEIHTWKVRELKDMGFKIEGDKWGYPMTVHGGAKVEVFTDENGQPHFKLASEEHVTWNKNYHWEETKSAGNTVAEHSGNKADKLINPYPDNKTDQLINPYPDNKTDHLINPYPENAEHPTVVGYHRGVNMPENSTTAENQQFRDLKRQWAAGNISQNEFAKEATRLTKHEVVYRDNQNGDHYFEQSTAPAAEHPTVVEHPVAHKEVRVSSDIKDRAVVHHAASKEKTVVAPAAKVPAEGTSVVPPVEKPLPEKVSATPEVSAEQETVGQFMQEHNTNTKEFINTYDKMVDRTIDHLQSSFILRGDARDFLHDKVASLYSDTGITPENFRSNNQLSKESLSMMQSILNAENKFKAHQSGWLKTFSDTMFDKNDKDMGLVLTTHRDVAAHPILANGSHGVRVWDAAKKKDIFIYAKDTTFTTEKKGRLVAEYADGSKDSFTQAELIRMSKVE